MATATTQSLRAQREAVVNAHFEAEAIDHDVAATIAIIRAPRYEVPCLGAIADGAQAVEALLTPFLAASPDLWLTPPARYHADDVS